VILFISLAVGVYFAVSVYLMLSRELKSIAMGVFLLGHAANLAILAVSRSPAGKLPPILSQASIGRLVDPLPQALILTAIVIGFAVQAFLLTLLIVTHRKTGSLELSVLAKNPAEKPTPTE
jgi:multicomponent Na+:H+ antiporter subunit C